MNGSSSKVMGMYRTFLHIIVTMMHVLNWFYFRIMKISQWSLKTFKQKTLRWLNFVLIIMQHMIGQHMIGHYGMICLALTLIIILKMQWLIFNCLSFDNISINTNWYIKSLSPIKNNLDLLQPLQMRNNQIDPSVAI